MKIIQWLMFAFVAMVLTACGGGSGGSSLYGSGAPSTGGTSSTPLTVKLALSSAVLTSVTPITVTATVTKATGEAAPGVSVAFGLGNATLASLSAATATTNSAGEAVITLTAIPGATVGSDAVTADATATGYTSNKATASYSTNSASEIDLIASANTAMSSGDEVTVSAIVKAAGGVGLKGAPVTFTTDTGTLKSPAIVTDASGVATVKFTAGANKANRTATIKVVSGLATSTLSLPIDGAKLSVSGATTVSLGTSTTLTVKASDNTGNAIAGADITVQSNLTNGLSKSTVKTDAQGQATLTYTASNAGKDVLTFKGLGASATSEVMISSVDFSFISPNPSTQVPVSTPQVVKVRYRQNGAGVSGQVVTFATTGGTLSASTATTDAAGEAEVTVNSVSAAPATVQATLPAGAAQATLPLVFVATTPDRLILQVSPTTIGPNSAGSTTNQSQVLAKVLDAGGNPVPGVTVNFKRDADPSGGDLLQGSATTDANGQATVQYQSGSMSTATNGVSLRGSVANTAVTGAAGLTVSQSALFIALGTGNSISNINNETYRKDWTVYVTDAGGVAVPNISITAKILPKAYRLGSLAYNVDSSSWTYSLWIPLTPPATAASLPAGNFISCDNEDRKFGEADPRSFNGILDVGEDENSNGKLDPGNVIALAAGSGNFKTDAEGRATISLVYAESYANWVEVRLQVQAIVDGTASLTETTFVVGGLASDLTSQSVPPAGLVSPFGTASKCTPD